MELMQATTPPKPAIVQTVCNQTPTGTNCSDAEKGLSAQTLMTFTPTEIHLPREAIADPKAFCAGVRMAVMFQGPTFGNSVTINAKEGVLTCNDDGSFKLKPAE